MRVNRSLIQSLSKTVSEWEETESRLQGGTVSEDEMETQLDLYLDTLQEFENKYGMSKVGEGRDRVTFRGGSAVQSETETVVKVSRTEGWRQNKEEVEVWKVMDEKTRGNVAKLLEWDKNYAWVIQEMVNQRASRDAPRKIRDRLKKCGWTCSDIRPENIGVKKGEPVLIDLGIGLRKIN